MRVQLGNLLLQRQELLAGVVRQLERARLEVGVAAEAAVKPDGDLPRDLERLQPFPVADAVVGLVGGQVASAAEQVEQLPHLSVQAQPHIHGAQQLGLAGLDQSDAEAGGNVLRNGFGQQAQLEHAAGGVEREQALGSGAEVSEQW